MTMLSLLFCMIDPEASPLRSADDVLASLAKIVATILDDLKLIHQLPDRMLSVGRQLEMEAACYVFGVGSLLIAIASIAVVLVRLACSFIPQHK
jgi:hypothetical protein